MFNHNLSIDAQAERLQKVLEAGTSPALADGRDVAALALLAGQLQQALAQRPGERAKAAARMAVLQRASQRRRRSWFPFSLLAGLPRFVAAAACAALALIVLSSASIATVAASSNALPGDPLYAVKTGVEQMQLALTSEPAARTEALAQMAARRTDEVAALTQQQRPPSKQVLQAMADQTAAAVAGIEKQDEKPEFGERLLALTERQQQVLSDVAAKVPAVAKPALEHAIIVSQTGHQQAQQAVERNRLGKKTDGRNDKNKNDGDKNSSGRPNNDRDDAKSLLPVMGAPELGSGDSTEGNSDNSVSPSDKQGTREPEPARGPRGGDERRPGATAIPALAPRAGGKEDCDAHPREREGERRATATPRAGETQDCDDHPQRDDRRPTVSPTVSPTAPARPTVQRRDGSDRDRDRDDERSGTDGERERQGVQGTVVATPTPMTRR